VRPGDFTLFGAGGTPLLDFHLKEAGQMGGLRKIGALFSMFNMVNPAPDFDLAVRLVAQGIHITWIYTTIPLFRWLMQKLEQEGKNLKRDYFPELKCVFQTGELSKSLLDYGCKLFGVPICSHSTVTETMLGGGSCMYEWKEGNEARMYTHMPEDTHFVEIFPPGSDKAVEGAEFGEAVITNLFSRAMAYIRFCSDDWAQARYDPCPYCGYTHIQCRWKSRVSESVNVKGKTITMGDIEDVLYAHPELRPLPAQLIREEPQPQDKLRLRVSYNTELVKEPEQFRLKLEDEFKKGLGVDTEITLITPEEVRAIAHKFERVIKEKRQS
jgi:phenylacetate-coenzyme A ligase PaaK-like adenylate-forming protein